MKFIEKHDISPEIVNLLKYPKYKDLFGIEYDWKNIDEGWYPLRRLQYLIYLENIKNHRKRLKRFTQLGYIGAFHLFTINSISGKSKNFLP